MQVYHGSGPSNSEYSRLYHSTYWANEPLHSDYLRWDDQWAALCYAHGIYGHMLPRFKNLQQQIDYVKNSAQRQPRKILEIGSGRGELSAVLDHMNIDVQSVDVNPLSELLQKNMAQHLFGIEPGYRLFVGDLDSVIDLLTLDIDTVIFVESIEHVFPDEWQRFYQRIQPVLQKNQAHFIATNAKWYWPLGHSTDCHEHVNLIDDVFYDTLAKDARQVLYRQTSHIVLAY